MLSFVSKLIGHVTRYSWRIRESVKTSKEGAWRCVSHSVCSVFAERWNYHARKRLHVCMCVCSFQHHWSRLFSLCYAVFIVILNPFSALWPSGFTSNRSAWNTECKARRLSMRSCIWATCLMSETHMTEFTTCISLINASGFSCKCYILAPLSAWHCHFLYNIWKQMGELYMNVCVESKEG